MSTLPSLPQKPIPVQLKTYEKRFQEPSKDKPPLQYDAFFQTLGKYTKAAWELETVNPIHFELSLEIGGPEALRLACKTDSLFWDLVLPHAEFNTLTKSYQNYLRAVQLIKTELDGAAFPDQRQAPIETLERYKKEWEYIQLRLTKRSKQAQADPCCSELIRYINSTLLLYKTQTQEN